jgi:DNA-binding transcriptional LysR family regulator
MGPSLRHLEIFRLFSRVLNVTETARLLRIAQPSVSQALKELEGKLGVELIVRGSGQLKLTADAEMLLKDMDQVLEHMHMLNERAARLRGEHDSSISIATVHPLTASIMPKALHRLRHDQPKAKVRIEAFPSREVVRRVVDRTADIGFTFLPVEEPDVVVRPLLRTDMICLVPGGHRLQDAAVVTPADLSSETIVTLGAQVRQEFDVRLAFDMPEDDARFITTNNAIVSVDLVRQKLGVAVTLPYILTQPQMDDVIAVPFQPAIRRTLVAVYVRKPSMTSFTRALLGHVREELRQFGRELGEKGIAATLP